jgi:hypothetical protein
MNTTLILTSLVLLYGALVSSSILLFAYSGGPIIEVVPQEVEPEYDPFGGLDVSPTR